MAPRLKLQLGDITSIDVEAVVNSTDVTLLAGGPVHVAIHRAAGPGLFRECEDLAECPIGEARLTGGHDLGTPWILHTVAPTWINGNAGEAQALAACYRSCLQLAADHHIRTLAFPSIGSGIQPQIPLEQAAPIAIQTILQFLEGHVFPDQVVLVCFNAATYQIHQKVLKEALP
jgi:O-acetyl-ADP-ribose deacetylase (regulator of RNase III)